MSEPHPKCSSKHRPAKGEEWEVKGLQGELQLRIEHMTPWTVEGPKLGVPESKSHRVIAARRCLIRRVRRAS